MLSVGTARCAVALPCLSTRTRSDRHFPDLAGACAKGGGGTIRPLLGLRRMGSPLLGAASATDKIPKLCVSVLLTAGLAKGLIG